MIGKLYINNRVYRALIIIIVLFLFSYFIAPLFWLAVASLFVLLGVLIYESVDVIKSAKTLQGSRTLLDKLSLGDDQEIKYNLSNNSDKNLNIELIDELPYQFQQRSSLSIMKLKPNEPHQFNVNIKPLSRGEYQFGKMYALISNSIPGLVMYKKTLQDDVLVHVYPSIIQMKKYALQIFSQTASFYGIRRVRTIGENDEFEHIRDYLAGDNIKSINWKATSRKGELLVNQFQDSRSQLVYSVIDKGRAMEMPFRGLSLLDYAINSALVISNIVLQKYDKSGLITFSNKIDGMIQADSNLRQLENINKSLYAQHTDFKESNFELLYYTIRKRISKRSILFLFTNFENKYELERNLPYIKMINRRHLLIVVSFVNTELLLRSEKPSIHIDDIYEKTIAESLLFEKESILKEMSNNGIQTILTKPEDLSINIINKYLEIKAKRMK